MNRTVRLVPNKIYDYDETRFSIENESNMFTNVDSDTYARITGSTSSNGRILVSGFDFSQVPSSAIVRSYSLKTKISSSADVQLSTSDYLYNKTSRIYDVETMAIYLQSNPYISSIANPMSWAELVNIGDDLCFGVPGRRNAYTDVYGVEIEVTYDLPVNKVVYGTTVLVDLTADTVTPETLLQGYTAHDKSGALITGTNTGGGNDFIVTLSYNESTEMWEPNKTYAEIQAAYEAGKAIAVEPTPYENGDKPAVTGEWTQLAGWVFAYLVDDIHISSVSGVLDGAIQKTYFLTANGIVNPRNQRLWVTEDATATSSDVLSGKVFYNADGQQTGTATTPTPTLQSKTATPTESQQVISPDSGYDGLSSVTVGAISSTYVGSGITRRTSADLEVSGRSVLVPAGYYSTQAQETVAAGSQGTPTATKGTVSNHSVSVTPSVTNTTGYITGSTKTGTAVTVSASELVSGSETKTANGTYDVTNLASVVVDVAQETFVVTVSKDQNDAWIPDKTYSEVAAAYNSGKTITVRCNVGAGNASADGSFANDRFVYWVRELSGDEEIETGYSYLSDSRVNVERYTYVSSSSIVTYHTSTSAPTSSQGNDGDIWLVTE